MSEGRWDVPDEYLPTFRQWCESPGRAAGSMPHQRPRVAPEECAKCESRTVEEVDNMDTEVES